MSQIIVMCIAICVGEDYNNSVVDFVVRKVDKKLIKQIIYHI
jgi:hypothetical protein